MSAFMVVDRNRAPRRVHTRDRVVFAGPSPRIAVEA
jgi:hypothetical protein